MLFPAENKAGLFSKE